MTEAEAQKSIEKIANESVMKCALGMFTRHSAESFPTFGDVIRRSHYLAMEHLYIL